MWSGEHGGKKGIGEIGKKGKRDRDIEREREEGKTEDERGKAEAGQRRGT